MVAKWFAWWNFLGLLGCVDYIRGQGDWEVVVFGVVIEIDLGIFFQQVGLPQELVLGVSNVFLT